MEARNTTYTDKIGLPPGSLVYIGEKREQKVTVSEINFSPDHYNEIDLKKISDCDSWDNAENVTVISVIGIHDTIVIEDAGKHFNLDPMVMEDIVNTQSRSKLEEFDDSLFLSISSIGIDLNSNEIIKIFIGEVYYN